MSFLRISPVLAVLLLAALLLAAPVQASSLRQLTVLSGPDVRLSDLFDDAGDEADRVLGTGPAPGSRLVIEAPQLDAIARQFGVDWRSGSGADRTVLERPGRPVPREVLIAALRDALAPAYPLPGELDVELPGFTPPMMPVGGTPQALIEDIDSDPASGRFSADISVAGAGPSGASVTDAVRFRVAGVARQLIQLPVLTRRLTSGEVIQPEDVRIAGVPVNVVQAAVVRAPAQAVGMSARRQLLPGQPIVLTDLGPPILVHRGGSVMLGLDVGGLSASAQGLAMESGGLGEHVRVLNTSSRAVVDAEVTGQGRARVLPGAVAILPAGHTTLPPRGAEASLAGEP